MEPIEIGSAVSNAVGTSYGRLKIGEMPDGSPAETPVIIARGAGEGPTLWLHGCVHGNEFCGTFIIHELLRTLDPQTLSGTVVALPMLNITACLHNERKSPFDGYGGNDLNRRFPGRADGGVTERMAYPVFRALQAHADYFVDFHTAMTADTRWVLYANHPGEVGAQGLNMARAYGFSSVFPAPPEFLPGSAMTCAARAGIPGMIVEVGGKGAAFDARLVEESAERLRNVLRRLGMLPGSVTDYGPLNLFAEFAWVYATRGGLFKATVKCGDRITEGQVIGHYFDAYGDPIGEAVSPRSGIVNAINAGPATTNGQTLVHVGVDPTVT